MNKNPYDILGINKEANEKDIKTAYRNLAKKYHPDLNPDNKDADTKFKEAGAAHDILKDKEKRAAFDRGEIDINGQPQHTGMAGGMNDPDQKRQYYRDFSDQSGAHRYHSSGQTINPEDLEGFSDIFGALFRGRNGQENGPEDIFRQQQNADVHYTLDIDFMDAATGAEAEVILPKGKKLKLKIPAGVKQGQKLRMKGKGRKLSDSKNGDAFVTLNIRPHQEFKRKQNDVYSEIPITISEAVLGGKIDINTVEGEVQINLPKGTSSGQKFRLKEKGIQKGHHFATVKIVMPRTIDKTLEEAIKNWSKTHSYNPRKRMEETE